MQSLRANSLSLLLAIPRQYGARDMPSQIENGVSTSIHSIILGIRGQNKRFSLRHNPQEWIPNIQTLRKPAYNVSSTWKIGSGASIQVHRPLQDFICGTGLLCAMGTTAFLRRKRIREVEGVDGRIQQVNPSCRYQRLSPQIRRYCSNLGILDQRGGDGSFPCPDRLHH